MPLNPRIHNNFCDANFFDAANWPNEVESVLRLIDEDELEPFMRPFSVREEIDHPNTPPEVKNKAQMYAPVQTEEVSLTPQEQQLRETIKEILRGDATSGKHDSDALHLVEADKYGGGYFITDDKRIVSKQEDIAAAGLSIRVVNPAEFLRIFNQTGGH